MNNRVYAVDLFSRVCPSFRLSQVGISSKQLNISSRKQRCTIAQRL